MNYTELDTKHKKVSVLIHYISPQTVLKEICGTCKLLTRTKNKKNKIGRMQKKKNYPKIQVSEHKNKQRK